MARRSQCNLRKSKSFGLLACGSSRRVIESQAVGKLMAATSGFGGYTMPESTTETPVVTIGQLMDLVREAAPETGIDSDLWLAEWEAIRQRASEGVQQ